MRRLVLQMVKKSVNVLESTAFLTLYAMQKLIDSLSGFLALCVWCLKKLVIFCRRWTWISLVQVDGGLDFWGLNRFP